VNEIILQILSNLKRKKQHDLGANCLGKDKGRKIPLGLVRHELRTNGGEGSGSKKRHKYASEDTMRGGTPHSTLERRTNNHMQLSSATTKKTLPTERKRKIFNAGKF